jgi:hypothetical protein
VGTGTNVQQRAVALRTASLSTPRLTAGARHAPARSDSAGWTEQEQQDVAVLREQGRELSATIVTHSSWGEVSGPERSRSCADACV